MSMLASLSLASSIILSPYKDVGIYLNWNTNVMSTGTSRIPLLSVLHSANVSSVVWAFATGSCGTENWAGVPGGQFAKANVKSWAAAGAKYTISTGGAAGSFHCTNDADFEVFVRRYLSSSLIGVDFDIEVSTAGDIGDLVQRVKHAQTVFPGLRWSFTLATLGGHRSPSLGDKGVQVMEAIAKYGLSDHIINLMAMDYGSASSDNCIVDYSGLCQMGLSAIQSAINLHEQFNIPYCQIEVTPMIGGNDSQKEVFTLNDVELLSAFAVQFGLAGLHHWSFDRDVDSPPGWATPTGNSYGKAGTYGFSKKFAFALPMSPTVIPHTRPIIRMASTVAL